MSVDAPGVFRDVFDGHPTAQLLLDARSGRIRCANAAAAAFFGRDAARLAGMRLSVLFAANSPGHRRPLHERLTPSRPGESTLQRALDDGGRHIELHGTRMATDVDVPLLLVSAHDVTEQVRTERRVRDYQEILEDVPVPFYRASPGEGGRFLRVNPALVDLFDAGSAEELHSYDITDLYAAPADRTHFLNALMRDGQIFRYELRMRTVTGRLIWTADSAFRHLDEDGNPVIDGILEDITRRRELEEELSYQARYDMLTELPNRRECETALHAEIERSDRYGQGLSALMIDIDHFKRINDERGHVQGDRVLQRVAAVIGARVRQADTPGRWGGEEFLVLLPSTPPADARRLAEELCRAVAEHYDGNGPTVTISVGYAGYRRGEGDARFLQRLDRALYAAKDQGRNRVIAADPPADGETAPVSS